MQKVAIFVDWENLRQEIEEIFKNPAYSVHLKDANNTYL